MNYAWFAPLDVILVNWLLTVVGKTLGDHRAAGGQFLLGDVAVGIIGVVRLVAVRLLNGSHAIVVVIL
ncbi:hypothetical protein [Thermoactinomyces daqus]|uniref:hypothetical protein n=1 Tax=Thermoactinomyces daqus TaxID=1329516 RepID=UPI001F2EEBC1|nr:hypothetical protein [Thermoactinomyces daqus]